jgi:hypothetical protein
MCFGIYWHRPKKGLNADYSTTYSQRNTLLKNVNITNKCPYSISLGIQFFLYNVLGYVILPHFNLIEKPGYLSWYSY